MDSRTKYDNRLFANSISYLHKISGLNVNPPATPTLKCLYLTKARLMELRKSIRVPTSTSGTTKCRRCFLNLIDGPASFRIKAEERKSKFAKKLLAKRENDEPLTMYQRKYLKRLRHINGNQLVITCKYCKKEHCVNMKKPKKVISSRNINISQKKKKNKKKDKFCGLNQEVVLSLTPENVRNCDASDFIPLEGNKKLSRVKLSKQENVKVTKEIITKESIKETQNKLKKKNKLKEFLNTSDSNKSSPTASLKNFLQSL